MRPHRGRCQEAAALSWAAHQPGLTAIERLVLVHLVDVADPRCGHVEEADSRAGAIGAALEVSDRHVRRALVTLANRGLVRTVNRPGRTPLLTVATPGRPDLLSPTPDMMSGVDNSNPGHDVRGLSPTPDMMSGVENHQASSAPSSPAAHSSLSGYTSRGSEGQAGLPGIDDLAGNRAERRRRQRAMAAAAAEQRRRQQVGR